MATSSSNQLTVPITEALRSESKSTLAAFREKADLGIVLTEDDRKTLKKVANRSRDALRDIQTAMIDFPILQSSREEMEELDLEIDSFDYSDDLETDLLEALKVVQDAKYFAGDRAYTKCSIAYGTLGVLAKKKGGTYKTRYDEIQRKHFTKTPSAGGGKGKNTTAPLAVISGLVLWIAHWMLLNIGGLFK